MSHRLQTTEWLAPLPASRTGTPFLSREQEAHLFRNRFSTYATWAIRNVLAENKRRFIRAAVKPSALYEESLTAPDSGASTRQARRGPEPAAVSGQAWLGRLDKRERRILASRYGIGGGPEQTLAKIGQELGISKERVRQIEARAHAKLRKFARLEALEPLEI